MCVRRRWKGIGSSTREGVVVGLGVEGWWVGVGLCVCLSVCLYPQDTSTLRQECSCGCLLKCTCVGVCVFKGEKEEKNTITGMGEEECLWGPVVRGALAAFGAHLCCTEQRSGEGLSPHCKGEPASGLYR